jgi:hypothetical protein
MQTEFLRRVVPEGLMVVAQAINGHGFKHKVCSSIEEAAAVAKRISDAGGECYFGLGSLKTKGIYNEAKGKMEVRVRKNIDRLVCLFADLDVGPEAHKYQSKTEALEAIDVFCFANKFPLPAVVDSGGGFHCYWPFTRPIAADLWRPIAEAFKAVLAHHGVKADPSRTADTSSVLRWPGTFNNKKETPRPVILLRDVPDNSTKLIHNRVTELANAIGFVPNQSKIKVEALAVPAHIAALGSNVGEKDIPAATLAPIIAACPQIAHVVKTGGEWYPLWWRALSLAATLDDPMGAAVAMSENHPDYESAGGREMMLDKMAELDLKKGACSCAELKSVNPSLCESCPHLGKITGPRQLGWFVKSAPAPIKLVEDDFGTTVEVKMPEAPPPYARSEAGGIHKNNAPKDGKPVPPIKLYEHDMYPLRRHYNERADSEVTVWRIKDPKKGYVEHHINQSSLADTGRLHADLLGAGVMIKPHHIKDISTYMIAYIAELQKQEHVETVAAKLGWRNEFKEFVLGDTIVHADGKVAKTEIAPELSTEVRGLQHYGTVDGWAENIQFYNVTNHEAHRFMLYASFGAPLYHMTGLNGGIILASGLPGVGKTTMLQVANSVWGHPDLMMLNGTSSGTTENALQASLSAYNNLPFCVDEVTLQDPKFLPRLSLAITQGSGKRRSTRSGALQRLLESWSTIALLSANNDAYASITQNRHDSSAEAMRILQIRFTKQSHYSKTEADVFAKGRLYDNYGVAGQKFMEYVITHYDEVKKLIREMTQLIDSKANITSAERFWSGMISATMVGGWIARQIGLLENFPVEHDIKWVVKQLDSIRGTITEHTITPTELVSEYLDSVLRETLVVSSTMLGAKTMQQIEKEPQGGLVVRRENDTNLIYIMRSSFKEYCVERGANLKIVEDSLQASGALLEANMQKVLGAGASDYAGGQTRCWKIDATALR